MLYSIKLETATNGGSPHLRQTFLEYLQAEDHGSSQSPIIVTVNKKYTKSSEGKVRDKKRTE